MKLSLVILAVVAVVAYVSAESSEHRSTTPVADLMLSRLEGEHGDSKTLVRQKRFTCDLLSFGARGLSGWNHAACATKCTATGHKGGHCDGANCKCGKKW